VKASLSHKAALRIICLCLTLAGTVALYGCAAPAVTTPTSAAATPTTAVATPSPSAVAPTAVSATSTPVGAPVPGQEAMVRFDCGSCHTIPGVQGANGTSAPSLAGYGSRSQILGQVPNTAANTASFIENPTAVVPSATMPNLGVPAPAAQQMADYLETLK
jgi:cytochrome c